MDAYSGKTYHFVGIGGIGTSGLAKLLMRRGATVSGSDMCRSPVTDHLCSLGAAIAIGHDGGNVPGVVDAVVISAAVTAGNPELARASELGCPIYKYAEMLGRLFDTCTGLAVCGTHGKSTVGAWISYLLAQSGLHPNYIIGAEVPQLGGSSGVGNGPLFVAEACEYDRSFLNLHPSIAVLLNIDQDHLDYYDGVDDILDAFSTFADGIKPDGVLIANGTDKNVARLLRRLDPARRVVTVGLERHCQVTADNLKLVDGLYSFDLIRNGTVLGRTKSGLPGRHNVYNALMAAAGALEAGAAESAVLERLGTFDGIDRRLMFKARVDGITVVDDYAHHPTEIRASLEALRQLYAPRRLWCIFQPHQYSRTRFLLDDFAESFKLADRTIVPEIYFVRDTAESRSTVNAEVLVERIRQQQCQALFINDFAGIVNHLKEHVRSGDLVVTMGAGTIWKVADEYIQWLREHR